MKKVELVPATDAKVSVMGRVEPTRDGGLRVGYPGVTVRLAFEGTSLSVRARSDNQHARFLMSIDRGERRPVQLAKGMRDTVLASNLPRGKHTVELVRLTETWQNRLTLLGFVLEADGRLLEPEPLPNRRLLFIGDSVTSGEGADPDARCSKEQALSANAFYSYGMRLARELGAQCQLVSYGGRGLVRDWRGRSDVLNAPQFFDLAVPDEVGTKYDHAQYPADAVVVALGTNDFSLGIPGFPDREHFVATYVDFVRRIRRSYPSAHVFLTEGSMVNDAADPARPQKSRLRAYVAEVVERVGDARVHAFESGHQPGDECNAHPTAMQHLAMMRELAPVLKSALGW